MARVNDKRLARMYKLLWEVGQIGWQLDNAAEDARLAIEPIVGSRITDAEILEIEKALAKTLRLAVTVQKQWKRVKFTKVYS